MNSLAKLIIGDKKEAIEGLTNLKFRTTASIPVRIEGRDLTVKKALPLHFSIYIGRPAISEVFLKAGADPNALSPGMGWAPIHFAAFLNDVQHLRLLHKYKANLDIKGKQQEAALHIAVTREACEFLKVFLQLGGNPDILNKDGVCPLHMGLKMKNIKIITLLVKYNARTDIPFNGKMPIQIAEEMGRPDIVAVLDRTSELLQQDDDDISKENKERFEDVDDPSTISIEEDTNDPYSRYKDPAEVLRKLGRKSFEDYPGNLSEAMLHKLQGQDLGARGRGKPKVKEVESRPKKLTAKQKQRQKWTVTTAGEVQKSMQEAKEKDEAGKAYDAQALMDEAEEVMLAEQQAKKKKPAPKAPPPAKPAPQEVVSPKPAAPEVTATKPATKPTETKDNEAKKAAPVKQNPKIVKQMAKSLKRVEYSESESESEPEPEPEKTNKKAQSESESESESDSDDIIAAPKFSQAPPKEKEKKAKREHVDEATALSLLEHLLEQKRIDQETLHEQRKLLEQQQLAMMNQRPIYIPVPMPQQPYPGFQAPMPPGYPQPAYPQAMPSYMPPTAMPTMPPTAMPTMPPTAMPAMAQPQQGAPPDFAAMQQRLGVLERALNPVVQMTQADMAPNLGMCDACQMTQANSVCPLCGHHFCVRCRLAHCNTECNPEYHLTA